MSNVLYVNNLEKQIAAQKQLIAEQNRLNKERQEWALHTNEVIRSLNQQLAGAIAACKQKDEALKWLMDWQVKHVDVWDNPAFDNAEEALATQPDDDALVAWLGEPVAWKHDNPKRHDAITDSVKELLQRANSEYMHRPIDKTEHYTIPLYAPKGMK
jgi:hypothetical protein